MKRKTLFLTALTLFVVFVIFTVLVAFVDKDAIGVLGAGKKAEVGFSTLNGAYKNAIGYTEILYKITDWASIIAILTGVIYCIIGAYQLVKRKSLLKVDASILVLGVTYIVLFALYLVFQMVIVVNYRAVLVDGGTVPESSYPSSTTLLSIGFMATSIYQSNRLIKDKKIKVIVEIASIIFMAFLIVGRAVSGVHWLTDIIGSLILGASVVTLYIALSKYFEDKQK